MNGSGCSLILSNSSNIFPLIIAISQNAANQPRGLVAPADLALLAGFSVAYRKDKASSGHWETQALHEKHSPCL